MIHHLVDQMRNVVKIMVQELVSASLGMREIHSITKEDVDVSANQTTIVLTVLHVFVTNALIHVLEHVALMQFVMFKNMFLYALALLDTQEIPSFLANKNLQHHRRVQTHVYHPLVDLTLNAEKLTTKAFVHVYQITLEALQDVDQNVLLTRNVPLRWLV